VGRHSYVQADGNNDHIRSCFRYRIDLAGGAGALRDVLQGFFFKVNSLTQV